MGVIKGNSLALDKATVDQFTKAVDKSGADKDTKFVRVKAPGSGGLGVLVDDGARGNIFGKLTRKLKQGVNEKGETNQLHAACFLHAFALEGTSGATLNLDAFEPKKITDRVVTRKTAQSLLQQGRRVDIARASPHESLKQIAENLGKYDSAGAGGIKVLKEHLASASADLQDSKDKGQKEQMDVLRDLAVGRKPDVLAEYPELKQAVTDAWVDLRVKAILHEHGSKPFSEILHTAGERLEGYRFTAGSEQNPRPGARIDPELRGEVLSKLIDVSISRAAEQKATQGWSEETDRFSALDGELHSLEAAHSEWSQNPSFKAAYCEHLSRSLEEGNLTRNDIETGSDQYDLVKADVLEAALAKAGLKVSADLGGRAAQARQKLGAAQPQASETGLKTNKDYFDDLAVETKSMLAGMRTADFDSGMSRFRNIKSPLDTNVRIKQGGADKPVHANKIEVPNKTSAIASQYPPNNDGARSAFWQMAIQNETNLIVDLTQPEQGGGAAQGQNNALYQDRKQQGKGAPLIPYYPDKVGEVKVFGGVEVECLSRNLDIESEYYEQVRYQVTDTESGESATVDRLHIKGWKDMRGTSMPMLAWAAKALADDSFPSVTVHCRAGVGRTGTLFVATMMLDEISKNKMTLENIDRDVDALIMKARKARGPLAVQTAEQRKLLVDLAQHWITNGTDS